LKAVADELTSGSEFSFKIRSTNLVGDGVWSSEFRFLIVDKPSPPLNVVNTGYDDTFVSLSWD